MGPMAERELIEQFDLFVEVLLTGHSPESGVPELAGLAAIAEELRGLWREEFRVQLLADLARAAGSMPREEIMPTKATPEGFHSLTPYLIVERASEFIDFLKAAFGAQEKFRVPAAGGGIIHAQVWIDDSILELADATEKFPPRPTAIHLYVPDVDETCRRAVEAGATLAYKVVDQEYGDREGSVTDRFGNRWYDATHKSPGAVRGYLPPELRAVTPYLHPLGSPGLIDFFRAAFGAEEAARYEGPDGSIVHAKIRLGDSSLELSEARGPYQPMPAGLHYFVDDVDAVYHRAIEAGGVSISEPADMPYGDRSAGVTDPAGNSWFIATHVRDVSF